MRNMSLSTKLIGGFMMMGLLLLIGGLLGHLGISRLGNELKDVSEVHFTAVHSLGTMIEAQRTIQRIKKSLLIPESFKDAAEKGRMFQRLDEAWNQAEKSWKIYEALPDTKEGAVLWNNLKPAWTSWGKSHKEVIQLLKEGKRAEALALTAGREKEFFAQAEKQLVDLSTFNLKLSQKAKQTGLELEQRQKSIVVIGTLTGILIVFLFGIFFAGSITKPIYRSIRHLSDTCTHFAAGSDQITSSSSQLAGGTSAQAAAVEETATVTEELTSINQRNTEELSNLKDIAQETFTVGMEAFEKFKEAKRAVKEIRIASEETSKIVKTISEIAFQTNLLALSASVEAAHNNEVGTGFSVVAQEVRNLAKRSTDAAKNANALIEETVRLVRRGDDQVRASLGSFISYGTSTMPLTKFTETAWEVAQKQDRGFEQINVAIGEITQTSKVNAASAQESASVAQEITAQANSLMNVVEELKKVIGEI